MANKQIRLLYPYLPLSSEGDFGANRYEPTYAWGLQSTGDFPITPKLTASADSSATRTVQPVEGGSTWTMTSASAYRPNFTNETNLWVWNTNNPPTIAGDTNDKAFIIGHKGVKSANNTVQSWQRSVYGCSFKHKIEPAAGLYGWYIEEMTMLYRKWSDDSKFYGVDLIVGGDAKDGIRKNYTGRTPFKTNSPVRDGYDGSFYAAITMNHPAYFKIKDDKLVWQGIYMKWGSYDSPSQFQGRFKLWNPRPLFDTANAGDKGSRVCGARMWEFQQAGQSNNIKLTYT